MLGKAEIGGGCLLHKNKVAVAVEACGATGLMLSHGIRPVAWLDSSYAEL